MSHASIPAEVRRGAFDADLVRLSIGIEDADDLIDDLTQAFERAGVKEAAFATEAADGG
jgi:cystathionine beta-lyase/cystathionine gamma-synthase